MKVLIISNLFPNKIDPMLGIFVKEQIEELSRYCSIKVIAPVPWVPQLKVFKKWYRYHQLERRTNLSGLEVFYPRKLSILSRYLPLLLALLYFGTVYLETLRLKKFFAFDIIHAHCVFPDALAAVLVGKIFKKPVVVTSHGADTQRYLSYKSTRKLVRFALNQANKVIAVCGSDKNTMVEKGVLRDKIVVISNGVDLSKFHPMKGDDLRQKFGLPLKKKIILYVGYLWRIKGVHFLIQALEKVINVRDDILLTIVGDGVLKEELLSQVHKANLQDYVKFVGFKPHHEIPLWMNACDLFCLPSLNEGCHTVLFEPMACGKPVVCTQVGGVPEIIRNDDYGILVEAQNIQALADGILQGLDKRWQTEILIRYAQENTWAQKARQIYELVYCPVCEKN